MAENELIENELDEETIVTEAQGTVDISDFFTKENSEKGVWFEPNVNGKIGIEFLVIGAESNEAAQFLADYDKDTVRINEIKDPAKRNEEIRVAMAKVVARLVKDIRPAEGVGKILIAGKPLTYSHEVVYSIMYNSLPIADRIIRFSRRDSDFMAKK